MGATEGPGDKPIDNGTRGMEDYLRVALLAAKQAGIVDLVTETDKKCEEIIFSSIRDAFPDHKFIGEEDSAAQGFTADLTDNPTWMVDPVDGTTNFVHRFPFVCVCIGLAIDKKVAVGVVYNPILDELYTAMRGKGAFLNGQPINVSGCTDLGSALIITEIGVTRDDATLDALFGRISAIVKGARSVRCMGSCALDMCSVACGRAEVSYEVGFGGPWDVAAASLIVEEAGGHVADPAGGPFDIMGRRVLAASNAGLVEQVAALIAPLPLGPKEPQPSAVS
ncbi:myo-inositol monophosphatase 2 [Coccomyxa subellipsoidea C-169]|uniref:Inositol-1-monophosphatase n=1 Tax=Coccomyxa subellipsoidea (strain C-169) TaxID=574566 RepID=I0Z0E2_COCSC|nr:myo-inositol monophosphatase 2 [Coccomyxa subellipsoidea C-169]EIE24111.1 myo-inositol monophosphatase 2 [Coccomyxa subellipsoidea C-169]|eukprot:XP_005648655.1 myo-inositol monophosphatase 2 [Coccomyxa subellipsoidea C-169]